MNNTEMMETLAIQTNEDAMTIESIFKKLRTLLQRKYYSVLQQTLSCNHRLYHC